MWFIQLEGALTFKSLGSFFGSSSAGVSSHVGIDDTPGVIGEYVKRPDKAWTQGNANPYAVSVELCAFAEWSPADWERHPAMLDNCARWIAEEAKHYGIPLKRLSADEAQGGGRGVCGHVDLGADGGGHWDPGPSFPFAAVIAAAKSGGSVSGGGSPEAAPTLGSLPFIQAVMEGDAMPDYCINDVGNGSRKFAVYPSGLVREIPGKEWQYIRDQFNTPIFEMNDKEQGERYFQYDQALRGQVKERE